MATGKGDGLAVPHIWLYSGATWIGHERLGLLTEYPGQALPLPGSVLSLPEQAGLCLCLPCRDMWLSQGPPSYKLGELQSSFIQPVSPRATKTRPSPHSVALYIASFHQPMLSPKWTTDHFTQVFSCFLDYT